MRKLALVFMLAVCAWGCKEKTSEAGEPGIQARTASFAGGVQVDPELPEYTPVQGVTGSIKSVGSDTMNNLMTLWLEGFQKMYPNVRFEIEGKGSSSGPPALISGTATFAPMSRPMKDTEMAEFESKFGYEPIGLPTSIDMLAVYVHKDNPLQGISFPQIDAVFSKTRKGGFPNDIRTWGQLGLTGEWADKPISLYGRNSASGTYGYFKEHALYNGDFKDEVKEQPGSSSVVQGVASDRYGVGYSGIGYKTADVNAVPVALAQGESPTPPEAEYALTGEYPLARALLLYVNHKPGTELEPLKREFARYIFSRQGQMDVVKDGYIPVSATVARETLAQLGIGAAQ